MTEAAIAWAPWHPTHGFSVPDYEGAIAFGDLDGACRLVRSLNRDDGTDNRNGWRAKRVHLIEVKT